MVGERTNESDRIAQVIILADVACEEAAQIVGDEGVYIVILQIIGQEIGYSGQEAVGEGAVIDRFHHFVGVDAEFVVEVVGDVLRSKALQDVRQEVFPHDGSAAFIAQDVTGGSDIFCDDFAVIEAGV